MAGLQGNEGGRIRGDRPIVSLIGLSGLFSIGNPIGRADLRSEQSESGKGQSQEDILLFGRVKKSNSGQPVVSWVAGVGYVLAVSVTHHGASPSHPVRSAPSRRTKCTVWRRCVAWSCQGRQQCIGRYRYRANILQVIYST